MLKAVPEHGLNHCHMFTERRTGFPRVVEATVQRLLDGDFLEEATLHYIEGHIRYLKAQMPGDYVPKSFLHREL